MLDLDQEKVVNYRGKNLLILASAGSGKTRTLVSRAQALGGQLGFEHLMLVTFTKKASNSISEQLRQTATNDQSNYKNAWVGTFHNICWRILSEYHQKVGLTENWTILDQYDSSRVMQSACRQFGVNPDEAIAIHSYSQNAMTDLSQLLQLPKFLHLRNPNNLHKALQRYKNICTKNNRLDFDGLLFKSYQLLTENKEICERYKEQFKAILVDEYQDTNAIQSALLKLLDTGSNITAVGDDAQSIYSFRAADVNNILRFEKQFNADKIILSTNYRNPSAIVQLAEASIRNNVKQLRRDIRSANQSQERPTLLVAKDQNNEAEAVTLKITELIKQGVPPNKIGILYRAEKLSIPLQFKLRHLNIPFQLLTKTDFFSQLHIKYVLNMMRLFVNNDDTISITGLNDLIELSDSAELSSVEAIFVDGKTDFWTSLQKNNRLHEFKIVLNKIQLDFEKNSSIENLLKSVIGFLNQYLERLANNTEVWNTWLDDFGILQLLVKQFNSLTDFLNTLNLQSLEQPETENAVILTSIHSAKGLEWDHVFLLGLVEYWFPFHLAIRDTGNDEEERRLFYVATTRAKKALFLSTYKIKESAGGGENKTKQSRFVQEIMQYVNVVNDIFPPDVHQHTHHKKEENKNDNQLEQVTHTYNNGSKYVGGWRDGQKNGMGTLTFASGAKYHGSWSNDKPNGIGTNTIANGEQYVGEWKDGKKHGNGTYTFPSGHKYTGEWKDSKQDGKGTYIYPSGAKYAGDWKDDEKNGIGTYTFPNGNKYTGEWKDSKKDGKGTLTWENGDEYSGDWKDSKRTGMGTLIFASGDRYIGEFRDGQFEGKGTLSFASGEKYIGEFKKNLFNGKGKFISADGIEHIDEFKDGYGNRKSIVNFDNNNEKIGGLKDKVSIGEAALKIVTGDTESNELIDRAITDEDKYPSASGSKKISTYSFDKNNDKGTITFTNGDKYTGSLINGVCDGLGTYTFENGDIYVGEFKYGKRHGEGTLTFARGGLAYGEWKNDLQNGEGTLIFSNGSKYVGGFQDGTYHGTGGFFYSNGGMSVGNFTDGLNDGEFTYTYPEGDKKLKRTRLHKDLFPIGNVTLIYVNGDKYVGEYHSHKCTGKGTLTFSNGDEYVGYFKDDEFEGQGILTFTNGDKYVGEFKEGYFHGKGTFTSSDGSEYIGDFRDDELNGEVTVIYSSGAIYIGEFKDDEYNGIGTYINAKGNKYIGEFRNGWPNGEGILFDLTGTIISEGIWSDNELIQSIQLQPAKNTNHSIPSSDTERRVGEMLSAIEENNVIGTIESAILNNERILINYENKNSNKWQVIRPLKWLIEKEIFDCFCEDDEEKKSFHIDRIHEVRNI